MRKTLPATHLAKLSLGSSSLLSSLGVRLSLLQESFGNENILRGGNSAIVKGQRRGSLGTKCCGGNTIWTKELIKAFYPMSGDKYI
jgi:hypothetical protein